MRGPFSRVQGVLHVMSTDLFLHNNMVQELTLIMLWYFHLLMKSSDPSFGMEYVPKNPMLNQYNRDPQLCPKLEKRLGLLTIMPNQPVRDKWDYPKKMERHFPIKPRQPIGIALVTILSFPNSLIRAKNRFVKFRSEYSNLNKWTTSRGYPEYSGRKKTKRTFPFEFRPKFPES